MQLFKGTIPTATTKYIAVPVDPVTGRLFLDVQWKDAISSATITLETTGSSQADADVNAAGAAWQWKTEAGITITGPAAAAAGSTKVHTTALCCRRARLKIVTAAACDFEIYGESGKA
jgi:hypothetical protein